MAPTVPPTRGGTPAHKEPQPMPTTTTNRYRVTFDLVRLRGGRTQVYTDVEATDTNTAHRMAWDKAERSFDDLDWWIEYHTTTAEVLVEDVDAMRARATERATRYRQNHPNR